MPPCTALHSTWRRMLTQEVAWATSIQNTSCLKPFSFRLGRIGICLRCKEELPPAHLKVFGSSHCSGNEDITRNPAKNFPCRKVNRYHGKGSDLGARAQRYSSRCTLPVVITSGALCYPRADDSKKPPIIRGAFVVNELNWPANDPRLHVRFALYVIVLRHELVLQTAPPCNRH